MMANPHTLRICQFGAGRIGRIHAENVFRHPDTELDAIVDVVPEAADTLARAFGARVLGVDAALADLSIDAVIIASATHTHAELTERAVQTGKAVFCEKPIDLDMSRVEACIRVVEEHEGTLFVGFNRRFDPSFAELKSRVDSGDVGRVEIVSITSRDPEAAARELS